MKKIISSIDLSNKEQKFALLIYRVEGSDGSFCIGTASEEGEHFVFDLDDVEEIIQAIREVTGTTDDNN